MDAENNLFKPCKQIKKIQVEIKMSNNTFENVVFCLLLLNIIKFQIEGPEVSITIVFLFQ